MTETTSKIDWLEWSKEAFERAAKEDKLVLLDVSAVWCHWCHVMDRTTYSDPEVIRMINEMFVPVRVDSDRRPDIQEKYLMGGWPTTAFLLPDGRIMTGGTYLPPETMIFKMREVDDMYHEQKSLVSMHVTSMAAEAEVDQWEADRPEDSLGPETIADIKRALLRDFDSSRGGFGTAPKFPYPDAVSLALMLYRRDDDPRMLDVATKTLDGMLGIYDPIWGGFYRYAVDQAWTQPHYEKLLSTQATAMINYLEAYQITGFSRYGETAAGIKAYIDRFLSDQEQGGFYSSHDADLGGVDEAAQFMPGEEYFLKNDAERLALGIPHVDKSMFTDSNGQMISAYLRMYEIMGDEHARDFALKTIDRLMSQNHADGHMCHYFDKVPCAPGLLSDQVRFGRALIDAYQVTADTRYLDGAKTLASFMSSNLRDVVDGGFYSQMDDPHATGALADRHKPFEENMVAARKLTQLYYLTAQQEFFDMAGPALRAASDPQARSSVMGASLALALDLYMNRPKQVVIVGPVGNAEAARMLNAALHARMPEGLVQLLDPVDGVPRLGETEYPEHETPAAYMCSRGTCSPPVKSADELAKMLSR